jgi:hypothetical protein
MQAFILIFKQKITNLFNPAIPITLKPFQSFLASGSFVYYSLSCVVVGGNFTIYLF